ncbi:hypothetical protein MNB_SUP05-5-483 [hydrothermal vent metagenome]|uniref:ATP-grasp domain-containing protein n=1 Tax=hydrothermal vent metagenome TaxID=652676 RepID=A0A1W1BSB2_9ZZZZ
MRIPPWWYFQINAEFYNKKKGYYSKLDIDKLIPEKWRLNQFFFNKNTHPKSFPVFLKPEWGQNANGIVKINNSTEFKDFKTDIKIPFIVQEAAIGMKEYEVFCIQNPNKNTDYITLTITETKNNSEVYPINNINNPNTFYYDITNSFSDAEIKKIKNNLKELPIFRITRFCIRTESKTNFINGIFQIVEINLFAPFPLNLLDKNISNKEKNNFIIKNMQYLVQVSKNIPKKYFNNFVFLKKIKTHYQTK